MQMVRITGYSGDENFSGGGGGTILLSNNNTSTTPGLGNTVNSTNTASVGDYLVDTTVAPYIRERPIYFYATGLRPGAKVHVFFDKEKVSDKVIPGVIANTAAITADMFGPNYITLSSATLSTRSALSDSDLALTVESNGTIAGLFMVPSGTYFVGDRDLVIADVSLYNSLSTASTFAKSVFHAYNFAPNVLTRPTTGDWGNLDSGSVGQGNTTVGTGNTGTAATGTITLYSQTNYNGNSVTFTTDYGNLNGYSANGISNWNDATCSVRVSSGSVWQLFKDKNYRGSNITVTANTPDISYLQLSSFYRVQTQIQNAFSVCQVADPIAQTFLITPEMAGSRIGCHITSIDVFFARKDSTQGVTLELRTTLNGYPTNEILPFSRKWLPPESVLTSDTGTSATTFTFDGPIFLNSGQEYAFVIIPDGNSPNYQIFTAENGQTDLASGTAVRQDWGNGLMFQSTNNSAWTAVQNEDIKFKIKRASFNTSSGELVLQNKKYEFFDLSSVSNTFVHGEFAFKFTANITGNVTANSANLTVTGSGTSFLTALAEGCYITVPDSNSAPTNYDLVKVTSIANNTSLTLERLPRYSVITGKTMRPVYGVVDFYDSGSFELTLKDSAAANATFLFANGDSIFGVISSSNATISTVKDITLDYFQPMVYRTVINGTTINAAYQAANVGYSVQNEVSAKFNNSNYIKNYNALLMSRSNEIVNASGNKSFKINVDFETDNTYNTPVVDLQTTGIVAFSNKINNSVTNEYTRHGSANSKGITKTVVLADGQEAEDIRVYISAYRPLGTDVALFAKILNASDSESFVDKAWSKLDMITANTVYSDSLNAQDIREYEYTFTSAPNTTVCSGVVTVSMSSATVTGANTLFDSQVANGSVIILQHPDDPTTFDVQKVVAVASNTALTISTNASFSSSGVIVKTLDVPTAAFKNDNNDGVVRYFGNTGGTYDGYKIFALKMVLLSNTTNLVPRISDIRAIALSV